MDEKMMISYQRLIASGGGAGKFVKKKGKCYQDDFLQVVLKSS